MSLSENGVAASMPERKSSEIARETLKLLAKRRQEPSPENYKALYDEVAGNGEEKRPRATSPINGWNNVQALQEPLAHLVESSLHGQAAEGSDLRRQATQITAFLRQPVLSLDTLKTMLETFNRRLDVDNEEYGEIQAGQGELLQLILRNIGVLTIDDHWLQGQTESLLAASTPPMSLRRLNALHDRMVEVIGKQKEAKQHLIEARDHMTGMIEAFLGTLRRIAACNEAHYGVIETCSRQMNKATTLEDITPVMREAFIATRVMADEALAMHSELSMIRQKAESTDAEIDRLRHQLDHLSALARHDALTGALNRRGLDEALEREISAAVRRGRVLSLALLDVDNFKAFNDRMGHEAGDGALLHLVEVVRECMRPQDVVARYGGEEFVLLLPETELNEALQALTRLQRELTQRLFLRDNEKILITFSAGVTQLVAGDTPGEALRRADQAMYLAKGAGKNRVQSA